MSYILLDGVEPLVLADGIPRESRAIDEHGVESMHMVFRDGSAARSCLLADWPAEQQIQAGRDAERQKHQAMNEGLRAAAGAHKGKAANLLTFPEMRDILALMMDERGMLDSDGRVR